MFLIKMSFCFLVVLAVTYPLFRWFPDYTFVSVFVLLFLPAHLLLTGLYRIILMTKVAFLIYDLLTKQTLVALSIKYE